MCISRQLWYSGLDCSQGIFGRQNIIEYSNGTVVEMHAMTFLTAVSIPSFTTIPENISAVHPFLFSGCNFSF